MTATPSAPAAVTCAARARSIPPMATRGQARRRPRPPHQLQAHHGLGVALGRGRERGSDREVVDRLARSRLELRQRVRGEADDHVVAQQAARIRRRDVVLAQVHPVRAHDEGDVGTVVHDEQGAAPARAVARLFGQRAQPPVGLVLRAQLHEGRAPRARDSAAAPAERPSRRSASTIA